MRDIINTFDSSSELSKTNLYQILGDLDDALEELQELRESDDRGLTSAEQAGAEALAAHHNASDVTYSYSPAAFHHKARAVVAAVRPMLAAEFYKDMAEATPASARSENFKQWFERIHPETVAKVTIEYK